MNITISMGPWQWKKYLESVLDELYFVRREMRENKRRKAESVAWGSGPYFEMVARELKAKAREIRKRVRLILKTAYGFPVACRCGAHVYKCPPVDGSIIVFNENGTRHVCPKPVLVQKTHA
jgi:hypothetical protein